MATGAAAATAVLDPSEARPAEAMVLDQAGSLTPAQLRAAIKRAVMEVAPKKAKERREHMAKRTRVERWAEDSGNAGLAGRELPPAEVGPGGSPPGSPASETCSSRSGPSRPESVITGMRPGAMILG